MLLIEVYSTVNISIFQTMDFSQEDINTLELTIKIAQGNFTDAIEFGKINLL